MKIWLGLSVLIGSLAFADRASVQTYKYLFQDPNIYGDIVTDEMNIAGAKVAQLAKWSATFACSMGRSIVQPHQFRKIWRPKQR